jgi:anthranilate phosphoribosyltransferase
VDAGAALKATVAGRRLSRAEARACFASALDQRADPLALAGLLAALAQRGEDAAEIAGAAEALRGAMVPFEHGRPDAIDTCGTGGDGLGTFNLSTATAIVAAAAGAAVIKHGNRAASSRSGSADLLEAAGLPLELSPEASRRVLERVGITFLFAPLYHPALRFAAPVRRALGIRTVFNLVGPLVNPGRVRRQLLGVPEHRRVAPLAAALAELGHERAYVVHGAGGADELTLGGENHVAPVGSAPRMRFDADALGLEQRPVSTLAGGDPRENLARLRALLDGEEGPLADALKLNAAAALVVAGLAADAGDGLERAGEALASGAARELFARWIAAAREEAAA